MRLKEGMFVIFFDKYKGVLGASDDTGWYIKTTTFPHAWDWDTRLPSSVLKEGDLCYWVSNECIRPTQTKKGNFL